MIHGTLSPILFEPMKFRIHNNFFPCRYLWPCLVLLCLGGLSTQADLIIYSNTLNANWQDWSWATVNLACTTPTHGDTHSISVTCDNSANNWEALYLEASTMNVSDYTNLVFWINGGTGGQKVEVFGLLAGSAQSGIEIGPLPTNQWEKITCSLSKLGVADQATFTGLWIQGVGTSPLPVFYVDDLVLQSGTPPAASTNTAVAVRVDALANQHPISPLIYGVAFATSNDLNSLNFTLNRSGGNSETRYNWQLNAHNLANDWYFESYPESSSVAGGSADDHLANTEAGGAQAMITIPMIGWMPKLGANRAILPSFSVAKYGAQTATDPWDADAGNGISSATDADITNDPTDANFPTNSTFQLGYVQHLLGRWHASTNGGVRFYLMDNEQSIWQSTHRDVHPVGPSMQEILGKILDYATMVKSNDPNAAICAPEEWGWSGYFYSGYDQQWSGLHNDYTAANFPDRSTNGGWDYMPWLLNQLHQHELSTGQRLLDYFTLHCYPQGSEGGNDISPATETLRNESTRQFWDTNYVDQSWIGEQATNNILMLIPRMKGWVAGNYPGTKIGITEYNWGAEAYLNGATAQADLLGIFGREGLDLATRWTTPASNTPTFLAMKIYRNYDGNRSAFGDTSVAATVPNPDNLSVFAAIRTNDHALTVMVINKTLSGYTPLVLGVTNFANCGRAQAWQLNASNIITRLADIPYSGGVVSNLLPAQSITLLVLPTVTQTWLRADPNAAPATLALWLDGQGGQRYTLQTSSNLVNWTPVNTNTLITNSFRYEFSTTNAVQLFYRAQLVPP
jgi:hypothetical protein